MRGLIIIEFRAEFSSIEGAFNNHEPTLGGLGVGFRIFGFWVYALATRTLPDEVLGLELCVSGLAPSNSLG